MKSDIKRCKRGFASFNAPEEMTLKERKGSWKGKKRDNIFGNDRGACIVFYNSNDN